MFCSPEKIHFKKTNKTVLDDIAFYLEDNNGNEVSLNGETIIFTLQYVKL